MANIRDVADSAGVSVATVSRALQQPERVSPKTREKVMAAVESVGYKPNLMAVKFRSGKTNNLVVLVPTVANGFFCASHQWYARSSGGFGVFHSVSKHHGQH
ncbi:hypothetical protein KUL49_32760 [Alteromonas sp. KUL49]|nr:LacI family DNA-binding transcriptional regulator [Alteromonas sp. KUL49]GEA12901.1 hypothetical protein KUL49_32760 [Alteromonas sp. KUL49]